MGKTLGAGSELPQPAPSVFAHHSPLTASRCHSISSAHGTRDRSTRCATGDPRAWRPRSPLHQCAPHPGDGCGTKSGFRPPGHAHGARAHRVRALYPPPQARPGRPRVAGPRPIRAVLRSREHVVVRRALPERLRSVARRSEELSAVGEPHTGPPGIRTHPGRRDDHRPAGTGRRQRSRHGARRVTPRRDLQPTGSRHHRSPHVFHLQRWRFDGRGLARGRIIRRAFPARQVDRLLRRQPYHDRRFDRSDVLRRCGTPIRELRMARPPRPRRQ